MTEYIMVVPLATIITKFLVATFAALYCIHLSATATRIFAAVAFAVFFGAGAMASLAAGLIYVFETRYPSFDEARSLPNMVMYVGIVVSSLACWLLSFALLEYAGNVLNTGMAGRVGRWSKSYRWAVYLSGALIVVVCVTCVVIWPSFLLTMYVSIPTGLVFLVVLATTWRLSWNPSRSPLGWLHSPSLWFLAGMIVSLIGFGESALLASVCVSGGDTFSATTCPFISTTFDPEAVYHVLQVRVHNIIPTFFELLQLQHYTHSHVHYYGYQILGYTLMWYGARKLCIRHKQRAADTTAVPMNEDTQLMRSDSAVDVRSTTGGQTTRSNQPLLGSVT